MKPHPKTRRESTNRTGRDRRGILVVLTGFCLCVLFAFIALSVDSGRIVLTETEMQNAVDAAALAASQEISAAVHAAGQGQGSANIDANSIAVAAARDVAVDVAARNGVFIDANTDVQFGKRRYDAATNTWPIEWGGSPVNVVRVGARRTGSDTSAPDGEFPLAFGWAVGRDSVPIKTSATAFVEARDLVLVLDFSGSMNDDSSVGSRLSKSEVDNSLDAMWDALREADPQWPGTSTSKFPANGFGDVDSYEGTYVSSSKTSSILRSLNLDDTYSNGSPKYPFPQSGRYSNGQPKPKPSASTSESLWEGYINYTKNLSDPYKRKYGYRTLMSYLQNSRLKGDQSEDLWRTPHYPFHAVKDGTSLFLQFLTDLDFGDEVGLVSYATWAESETYHSDGEFFADIRDNPITDSYSTIDAIQRHHQAGHYDSWTGIGAGVLEARMMLVGDPNDPDDLGYVRYGARPTIILMTDGNANRYKNGWSLPGGFDWDRWTDYNDDGNADYTTSDRAKQYALWEATRAVERGITIHTLAVGADADRDLMRAIAHAGGGVFISVPGGSTIDEMEDQLIAAFGEIAAKVPPAKLVYDLSTED